MKGKNISSITLILICVVLLPSLICFAKTNESKVIKHQYGVNSVRFSPDGGYLAIAGGQSIILYDMERNRIAKRWSPNFWIYAMDFAPDGEKIAVGGTSMDIPIYKIRSVRRPSKRIVSGTIMFLDFSPDGRWLAAKSMRKPNTIVFGLTNDRKITLKNPAGLSWWPSSPRVLFSPNGRLFAAAGNPVIMWEVRSWKEIAKLSGTDVSIAFSPTSLTLAVGTLNNNREIVLWRTNTGTKRLSFQSKRIQHSTYIDFSPGGHYLAVAGGPNRNTGLIIEIWKVKKKRVVKVLEGHSRTITTLDFSPDGKWLASGSYDKTVRLWDISSIADPAPQSVDATDKIATTWGQVK